MTVFHSNRPEDIDNPHWIGPTSKEITDDLDTGTQGFVDGELDAPIEVVDEALEYELRKEMGAVSFGMVADFSPQVQGVVWARNEVLPAHPNILIDYVTKRAGGSLEPKLEEAIIEERQFRVDSLLAEDDHERLLATQALAVARQARVALEEKIKGKKHRARFAIIGKIDPMAIHKLMRPLWGQLAELDKALDPEISRGRVRVMFDAENSLLAEALKITALAVADRMRKEAGIPEPDSTLLDYWDEILLSDLNETIHGTDNESRQRLQVFMKYTRDNIDKRRKHLDQITEDMFGLKDRTAV